MSHQIGKFDKHQGITQAWHNLTEVHAEWKSLPVAAVLAVCFLSTWDVIKRKLFRLVPIVMSVIGKPDGNGNQFVETDTCELTCSDNPDVIIGKPVHCETYHVLTNRRFMDLIVDCAAKIPGAFVASVLSCCDRARIAIALSLPRELNSDTLANAVIGANNQVTFTLSAAKRDFEFYLQFLSSHDKSSPLVVMLSTICTVCNNTFDMNLHDTSGKRLRISIAHTKNMELAIKNIPEVIAAAFVTAEKFVSVVSALAEIPCDEKTAREFFTGFLVDADAASDGNASELSTRRENQIIRLVELFQAGKGNHGENYADVFSAITDYYSHESSGDDVAKQVASSQFGNGAAMKALAFVALQDDARIADLIALGAKSIAETERLERERLAKESAASA